jgi:hypothetical protein
MARKITSWVVTSLLAALATLSALALGPAVHKPHYSRIAEPLGRSSFSSRASRNSKRGLGRISIRVDLPAFVAHYLANDGRKAFMPLALPVSKLERDDAPREDRSLTQLAF